MPQLDMWEAVAARSISWTYQTDPLAPEARPKLIVLASNLRGQVTDSGMVRPQHNVVHEEVCDALKASWEAYLFGEPGDVRAVLGRIHKVWEREANERPIY